MRAKTCEDCNCLKSLHRLSQGRMYCFGCYEVWKDNRKEYHKAGMHMWHDFKMNNLKWLEEQYEKTL